jgi:glycosyltransferase involved in cell wall biosynthesis
MRIGIQMLSHRAGQTGGQEINIVRMLGRMLSHLGDDNVVLFLRPDVAREPAWRPIVADPHVELVAEKPDDHYGPNYEEWNLRLLESARLNVVYFPLFFFFPRPLPIPVIVHVPDVQHEYYPQYFPADELKWRRERIAESVALADAVITFPPAVPGVLAKLSFDRAKLHPIDAGGFLPEDIEAALAAPDCAAQCVADQPFFLYPAGDWPHKNHETLLHALGRMVSDGRPEHLVFTGMVSRRGAALRALADELGIADRVHWLGCVPQDELIRLYRAARGLAFPSRFEGFGMPLVEAMQLGCPIVASHATGVTMTAGDAAAYCEDDPSAWAAGLAQVSHDADLREDLRRRGFIQAAKYDWDSNARQHIELLRTVAERAGHQSCVTGMGSSHAT